MLKGPGYPGCNAANILTLVKETRRRHRIERSRYLSQVATNIIYSSLQQIDIFQIQNTVCCVVLNCCSLDMCSHF